MKYEEFLATKTKSFEPIGLTGEVEINEQLFPFQRDIVRWALRRGRAAIFADCGLGKTPMQLEWARHIPGEVLILAPFAGIGSEGYCALRMGRKFIGAELKDSYWEQAKKNLAVAKHRVASLFDETEEVVNG